MGEVIRSALGFSHTGPVGHGDWFWHRQLKKPFFGRFMKPWRWPQNIPREGWESLRIASRSHSSLAAIVKTSSASRIHGVVVCAHPMGLAAKGFWLRYGHAQELLDAGFHVVCFDFNGFGESPSTNMDYPGDAISVGQWARTRFPGMPLHALCASFGAMKTIDAIDDPDFPFDSVVAEGCSPTLAQFWKHYPVAHAALTLGRWIAPQVELRLRPVYHLMRKPLATRVLLIHSKGDRWTPPAFGVELASCVQHPSSVLGDSGISRLVLSKADHTHGMRDEPDVYFPAVRRFFMNEKPIELHE